MVYLLYMLLSLFDVLCLGDYSLCGIVGGVFYDLVYDINVLVEWL